MYCYLCYIMKIHLILFYLHVTQHCDFFKEFVVVKWIDPATLNATSDLILHKMAIIT